MRTALFALLSLGLLACDDGTPTASAPTEDAAVACRLDMPDCDFDDDGVINADDPFPSDPACASVIDGCETCGVACNEGFTCVDDGDARRCGCAEGLFDLDGDASNGCECEASSERCDGLDNDCDGEIDEHLPELGRPCDGDDDDLCEDDTWRCTADGGGMACADGTETGGPDLCDGVDNDCDPSTPDGAGEIWFGEDCDGDDTDLCPEGTWRCEDGAQRCDDDSGDRLDMCDGVDNDCDPTTPDGAAEPWLDTPCDGPDADLCPEGVFACVEGAQACTDATDDTPDLCDGEDDDCDPETPDGAGEAWLDAPCDGPDADLCPEGTFACAEGAQICSDTSDNTPDLCDGVDNDCDPATADGVHEAWFGEACDGDDRDLCPEGALTCTAGVQTCDDESDDTPDLCDGADNDCDPTTADGAHETWLDQPCDGDDADLCPEGTSLCTDGAEICTDQTDATLDLCDGEDNDCDPATADGAHEPWLAEACDGDDADLCPEGAFECVDAAQICTDETDDLLDLCDGEDNDCDPATADGAHAPWLGDACDGDDADLCPEGAFVCVEAARVCTDETDDTVELCDGVDNDCDERVDEDFVTLGDACGDVGPCWAGEPVVACDEDGTAGCQARHVDACVLCDGDAAAPCNGCPVGVDVPEGWVCVPAGSFWMGSDALEPDEQVDERHHQVVITRPFLMKQTEVTQAEWFATMGNNPSSFQAGGPGGCVGEPCETRPVERVSWTSAVAFVNERSVADRLSPCYDATNTPVDDCTGYRLPTEAEWAYAARADGNTWYGCGDDPSCLTDVAWYAENADARTHVVAQKTPNAWGLFDMLGNVWEWTNDLYVESYAVSNPAYDPAVLGAGAKVDRGGAWTSAVPLLRPARRDLHEPNNLLTTIGFRPVLPVTMALPVPPAPVIGDLVITEIMQNPAQVGDSSGEWFEVKNVSDHLLDLNGLVVSEDDGDDATFTVDMPLRVPAGGYALFARHGDRGVNGGLPVVDFKFPLTAGLSNVGDEIMLLWHDVALDRVGYDGGPIFPDPSGQAMQFDGALDETLDDNDDGTSWCAAWTAYGIGDMGTPGADNPPCAACGNGRVDEGESCDDANGVNDDGCHNDCSFGGEDFFMFAHGGWRFYQVPAIGLMIDLTVSNTCEGWEMLTPCAGAAACEFNNDVCTVTSELGCADAMLTTSMAMCGTDPAGCEALDDTFAYMGESWAGGAACGVVSGEWCVQGGAYRDRFALCARPE